MSGISLSTTKEQMLRALLESVAFSQKQLVDAFLSETDYKFEKLVVDGGVAQNDFIICLIANLTGDTSLTSFYFIKAKLFSENFNHTYHFPCPPTTGLNLTLSISKFSFWPMSGFNQS